MASHQTRVKGHDKCELVRHTARSRSLPYRSKCKMNLDTELELEIFNKGEVIFREDPLGRDHTSGVCRELSVRGPNNKRTSWVSVRILKDKPRPCVIVNTYCDCLLVYTLCVWASKWQTHRVLRRCPMHSLDSINAMHSMFSWTNVQLTS